MLKYIAVLAGLMMVEVAHAEIASNLYEDLDREAMTVCAPPSEHGCWKPFAEHVAQLKPATNEKERDAQLFIYWMLSKTTERMGDYADSAKYLAATLDLAKAIPPQKTNRDISSDFMSAAIKVDIAELDLIVKDYSGALSNLDDFITAMRRGPKEGEMPEVVTLRRCAALIGLNRSSEADLALQRLLEKLDFDGRSPWEGWPFVPPPVSPYDAARRIAAHWTREGKYEQALALLQTIQTKRQRAIAHHAEETEPGTLWAIGVSEADILDDEAVVYLAQRRDDPAESLLRTSLQTSEKDADKHLTRTLTMLAALERRKGAIAEADALVARIVPAKADYMLKWPDPLAETLGLEDPK